MAITVSNRDEPISGHTHPEVKEALRREAAEVGESMSAILSEALRHELERRGHRFKEDERGKQTGRGGAGADGGPGDVRQAGG